MYCMRWFRMAALYFVIGSSLGLYMSIANQHHFAPLHAHINLLGWVSMAAIGAAHRLFPTLEGSKLAPWAFWAYHLGFPLFMGSLWLIIVGNPLGEQTIPIGSNLTLIAIILNAIGIWLHAGPSAGTAKSQQSRPA